MDNIDLLKIYDREQRQGEDLPGTLREVTQSVVRVVIPDEHFGFIPYSKMDASNIDDEIEAQIAYFRARNMGFEWKVYDHDGPTDMGEHLKAHGFRNEEPEALMMLDLQDSPEVYQTMDTRCVARITDPVLLEDIIRMEEEVWNEDHSWMRIRLGHDMVAVPDLLSVFAVLVDGRAVSAAWMYYQPASRFASLWGGSTLPAYRKRGYYTALLVARAREASERGYRFLTVDASPMSRPILEKHGFHFLGFSTPYKWRPESQAEEESNHA